MYRSLVLILFIFLSCINYKSKNPVTSAANNVDSTYQELTTDFLFNLYYGNDKKVLSYFDTIVSNRLNSNELEVVFKEISTKIRKEYESPVYFTFITSEKTFHENVPATFIVVKAESVRKFGYYFFYISDLTGKVILFSEFAKIKETRG